MTATAAWLASIEALLNRGVAGSAQAAELAERLDATAIRIEIEGLPPVQAGVLGGKLALMAAEPGIPADATLSGSPLALLKLARGASIERTSSAAAQVRGDAEVANSYRRLFALARPDLEEELSRVIGDFPARRLARLAARTLVWARQARHTAGADIAEYLQEESRDLVNKPELQEFLRGVDTLRDTAERIEARLVRLERRLKGLSG